MGDDLAWHVVSYPRSGNHLVRAIMEAYTGRPTEGVPGSLRDTPIHARQGNADGGIAVTGSEPIGYKAHVPWQVHERARSLEGRAFGMVLITRDPVAAISSQATRLLSNRRRYPILTSRRKRLIVQSQVDRYLSVLFLYAAYRRGPKLHLRFEDLTSEESAERSVRALLEALGARLEGPPLAQVYAMAKESQDSLVKYNRKLKAEIEEAVRQRLSYAEAIDYLRDA